MSSSICVEIVKGLFTLAAVVVGAGIGMWAYFRQKEYELVKQRYLEGAIDVVSSELEHALGVVSHNWARCLNIVKAYRDQQGDFDVAELARGFLDLDASKFHRIAHHRLHTLLGTSLVWDVYQLAMAHCSNVNTVITKEIPDTIRVKLT